ncbi:hypothetical protein KQ940_01825 [Marinobacterium sp. D7]|uniref:hypothetical protein n=1 Tax=Marinobacterium ramblicola TaxID=2849041 RepID=UPI001C2D58AA|nr:hypothetical protein [Marinobacterium ramblicola]MBV1786784.1 hypothetical protein [Marinobacterium ramblicola]
MKKPLSLCALIAAFLLFAGCESIQLTEPVSTSFSALPPDKAQVRIGKFGILINQTDGAKAFHFLLGAPQYPVGASIYDVTGDIRYLGNLAFDNPDAWVNSFKNISGAPWIEFQASPGRTTLMLVEAPAANTIATLSDGFVRLVDFIEFDTLPGQIRQIVLTRHGIMLKPQFNEIAISGPDRVFCEGLAGSERGSYTDRKTRKTKIETYMQSMDIDSYRWDFRRFCELLSEPKQLVTPSQAALQQFSEIKDEIAAIRDKHYPIWKEKKDHPKPYDLMKSYEPKPKERRTESWQ